MSRRRTVDEVRESLMARSVVTANGCREFRGYRDRHGYGQMRFEGHKGAYSHRVAYAVFVGPIPNGLQVLHHCDNPPCFQTEGDERWPEGHLFLGSQLDNIRDATVKGRVPKGERHCLWGKHPTVCRRGHLMRGKRVKSNGRSGVYCLDCHNAAGLRRKSA